MKSRVFEFFLFAEVLFLSLSSCCFSGDRVVDTSKGKSQDREETKMSQISDAVLALDLSAADLARAQGAAAITELSNLLQHEDNAVRTVATIALGGISHPEAYRALMRAAEDEDDSVASAAVEQLSKRGPVIGASELTKLLGSMKSDAARRQLVLTIGTVADESEKNLLSDFCLANGATETTLSCMAALAKLGSEESRKDFSQYLVTTRDLEAFQMAEYIGQPWLLPYLGQLLRYRDPVQTLGDPPPGFPNMLRVCDKAVVLIAEISGREFSFPTNVHMNYDEKQLSEAARVAGCPF